MFNHFVIVILVCFVVNFNIISVIVVVVVVVVVVRIRLNEGFCNFLLVQELYDVITLHARLSRRHETPPEISSKYVFLFVR